MATNIFERATHKKLRIKSSVGDLTVENLWDLPLTYSGKSQKVNLDDLARSVNAELKDGGEESFVHTKPSAERGENQLRLDILKHIIAYKLKAIETAEERAAKASRRAVLQDALAKKRLDALSEMDESEIAKELAELGG